MQKALAGLCPVLVAAAVSLCSTATAFASPTYVGKTTAGGASSSLTVAAPAGVAAGDVQLAFVQVATQSETLGATPAGWTKLQSAVNTNSADSAQTAVYSTTTAIGSATFTKSGSRGWLITRVAYTGTSGTGPSAIALQGSSTSHASPSVTTVDGNDLVVGLVGSDRGTAGAAQSWTPPSGWTERQDQEIDVGGNPDLESEAIADVVVPTPGAKTGTFTAAVRDDAIAAAVVVKAAAAGTVSDDTSITSGPADPTTDTSASFSFTASAAGSTFQCQLDGGGFSACTSPRSYAGLAAGTHTFQVRATDAAGDTDPTPASDTWTISAPDGGWTNVIDDQFNTDGPVPSHWHLYNGPYGSGPHNCANPSHATVSGGMLHMLMKWDTSSCAPNGGWETAGMQIDAAYGGVDQRVTVRWRIVQNGVADHHIIPMRWPDDPNYQWYQGESDYCESSSLTGCTTFLHYANPGQISHSYSVDLTQWHTWRIEAVGDQVKVYIDDMTTPVWTYNGTSTTLPASFKRTVLQQECQSSGCPAGTTGTSDIQIDWITIDDKS